MDATDTLRLRALLERATPGPWSAVRRSILRHVDGEPDMVATASGGSDDAAADAALIVAAVNALPALCDEVDRLRDELRDARADLDAQSFLRPHPSKRTGIRCARCGRDGGVDCGDDMPVCPWCSDAVTAEVEREACAGIAAATQRQREERLRALDAEGVGEHDPARLCLVVAIKDAEEIARKIRARGDGGR